MRKAIASVGLAAVLSLGIGNAAFAQTSSVAAQTETETEADDDDSFVEDNLGLLGLLGLIGLAGLGGRGGGSSRGPKNKAGYNPNPGKRKGGYSSDWSNR